MYSATRPSGKAYAPGDNLGPLEHDMRAAVEVALGDVGFKINARS